MAMSRIELLLIDKARFVYLHDWVAINGKDEKL